ncbi:UDP-galactose transporter Gms1 [Coemansia erecta]|nr:UDP-galactose transporter Gms1 [Coemansia sp. RSA 2618]KAJ2830810.1 UDP-galactose transporter Gms1 [Coemansia erecta]
MLEAEPLVLGVPLKYVSLLVLTVQNSMLVLVMRYSRVVSETQFYPSTAVLMSELAKFAICLAIAAKANTAEHGGQFSLRRIRNDILGGDSWKMIIPAGLYTIQNNLQYTAVSLLDAATFQVTYQLKILTTAVCSVAILGTQLSLQRWISLVVLTLGIILVQFPADSPDAINDGPETSSASYSVQFAGLLAVFVACVLSGLAGVYFEKVLKGSRKSIWTRNVQMSLFSIAPALFGVLFVDGSEISHNGFFYGYTVWTCAAIACQALGGLIVAVVVKYADNILKGFATSISIILSCVASVWIFGFRITPMFIAGTALVVGATYMYGRPDSSKQHASAPLPLAADDEHPREPVVAVDRLSQGSESIPMTGISSDAKFHVST